MRMAGEALLQGNIWKILPCVVMVLLVSVSVKLASRVIINTANGEPQAHPMNNCEFNGFVMPGAWTDRGRLAYGMFWQDQNNETRPFTQ